MKTMKFFAAACFAMILLALAGCETMGHKPPPPTRVEYHEIPEALLTKGCKPVPPPHVADYVAASTDKQKEMLIRHDAANISVIQGCDDNLSAIRSWNTQQKKIYAKP